MGKSAYTVTKASTERVMAKEIARAKQYPGAALFRPMTNVQLREIRTGLLELTQAQLAAILGYQSAMRISEFERDKNPLPIPSHIAFAVRIVVNDPTSFWDWNFDGHAPDERDNDPFAT